MDYINKDTIEFENKTKYKFGAITYIVTAHFYEENETLKTKISTLLTEEIYKNNLFQKSCNSRNSML